MKLKPEYGPGHAEGPAPRSAEPARNNEPMGDEVEERVACLIAYLLIGSPPSS